LVLNFLLCSSIVADSPAWVIFSVWILNKSDGSSEDVHHNQPRIHKALAMTLADFISSHSSSAWQSRCRLCQRTWWGDWSRLAISKPLHS
jgi:hypothetical protein